MKLISRKKLSELAQLAEEAPRRRSHFNLHETLEDPVQRLIITSEASTVYPVHRHADKWELLTILRGHATVYLYADDGSVLESCELTPEENPVAELPVGVWHNMVIHEDGTAVLEVKPGPYVPNTPENTASFEGMRPAAK